MSDASGVAAKVMDEAEFRELFGDPDSEDEEFSSFKIIQVQMRKSI